MQSEPHSPKRFSFENKPHLLIVEARYYEDVATHLLAGAQAVLDFNDTSYEVIQVPGALEIPAAISFAVKSLDYDPVRRRYDGYVALGCVVKGETHHDVIVGQESARGLQELALRYVLAIGNGILTVNTKDQALARADIKGQNRGGAAADACLRMIELKQHFRLTSKRRWVAKS
jgi:6,7-dimethyl-8-ribityllumazine synthase